MKPKILKIISLSSLSLLGLLGILGIWGIITWSDFLGKIIVTLGIIFVVTTLIFEILRKESKK